MSIDWKLDDRVAVITMDEDANKFNTNMVKSMLEMLDAIEKETMAQTLVVKSGHSHIWAYGFDIDWLLDNLAKGNNKEVREFLYLDLMLRKRLLTYPLLTIAALNGHCFGGGAIFSCCFDFRFMRSDRGYFCIPLVDRKLDILPSTHELLINVLPGYIYRDLMLTGRRLTGTECAANHVVTAAYKNEELLNKVMAYARGLNKERGIVEEIKKSMNGAIARLIQQDADNLLDGKIQV